MPNDMKRMNYFDGLLLKEEDLTLDQEYHSRLRRLHNRHFHDWGIVTGLSISMVDRLKIEIAPGMALNRVFDPKNNEEISQEILIGDNHPGRTLEVTGFSTTDTVYVTVSYNEELADKDSVKGGDQEIHVSEIPKIRLSSALPADPRQEIVLGRIILNHDQTGGLAISEISELDPDGNKVVTRAVGGQLLHAKKLIVGSKEDPAYPYLSGAEEDQTTDTNNLYVHAAVTEFSGAIKSGPVHTYGNVDVNGTLTVKVDNDPALKVNASGDVELAGSAAVSGILTARGGLEVSGGQATLDVPRVVVSGSMLTMNQSVKEQGASGMEVGRKDKPSAMLVWDEADKSWKIGTEASAAEAGSGLYKVAYGPDWDNMHNGSRADDLHKHSLIHSLNGEPVLSADSDGSIVVEKTMTVNGSLISGNGGLEVARGKSLPNAKIAWNEATKTWQIGTVGGEMNDIPDGKDWDTLTSGGRNADALHTHTQFHSEDKKLLALEIGKDGNVSIPHELNVGETLTVKKLVVEDEKVTVTRVEPQVDNSFITVNKAENGSTMGVEGGLAVHRGGTLPEARMEWDEADRKWKIGIKGEMADIPYGTKFGGLVSGALADPLHKHSTLSTAGGSGTALAADANGNLQANGNLKLGGTLEAGQAADLKANLNVGGNATIQGDLVVKGKMQTVEKIDLVVRNNKIELNQYEGDSSKSKETSIEVFRGKENPKARIVWDEDSRSWKLGIGTALSAIAYGSNWEALTGGVASDADGLHKHSALNDSEGKAMLAVNSDGNIEVTNDAEIMGTLTARNGADIDGGMSVKGVVTVDGSLFVKGTTTSVTKEELVVKDSTIQINKFDGDDMPVDESGLEVYRGNSLPAAKILWDESERAWKVGTGEALEVIASGSSWDKLTKQTNADALHNHSQLYDPEGNLLALSAIAEGDVDIHHNLSVGSNLVVGENLEVRGPSTTINSDETKIKSSTVILNRNGEEMAAGAGGGIEVYRGKDQPAAQVAWDETKQKWKLGVSGMDAFAVDKDGNVTSGGALQAGSANFRGALTAASASVAGTMSLGDGIEVPQTNATNAQMKWVKDRWKLGTTDKTVVAVSRSGKVGIGTEDPTEVLDVAGKALFRTEALVYGDATVSGNLNVGKGAAFSDNATFNKTLTAQDAVVKHAITVKGTLFAGGIEFERGQDSNGVVLPNAKLLWDNEKGAWFYGTGTQLTALGAGAGAQNKLFSADMDTIAVFADSVGNVGVGTNMPRSLLDVNGDNGQTAFAVTKNGKVGIGTADPTAQLDVRGSATIGQDLTVAGNLTVNGDMVTINAATLEVEDNIVRVNKYANRDTPMDVNGGLEVFRGGKAPAAQLLWDEAADQWVAGVADSLKALEYKGHTHPEMSAITDNLKVSAGNIGIGTAAPTAKLDVNGSLNVTGNASLTGNLTLTGNASVTDKLTAKDAAVSNKVTAKDAEVTGSLTVAKGMEVARGSDPKAQLQWNETADEWQAGVVGVMKTLAYSDHTHQELTDLSGAIKVSAGNVGIGTAAPAAMLDVAGTANIAGNATIAGNADIAGNASVTAKLTAKDAEVTGALTAKKADVSGALTVKDASVGSKLIAKDADITGVLTVSQGLEADRGADPKAQILWNEDKDEWQLGVAGSLKELAYSDHTHADLVALTGAVTVNADNNVGIGKTAEEDYKLDVNGKIRAVNLTQTSSRLMKESIAKLSAKSAMDLLNKLTPVTFRYKEDIGKKDNIGFIAEDVPDIFSTSDHKAVSLMDIIGVLTSVVQKQHKEAADLQKQVKTLQKQVAALAGI